jgi:hypothetical protein
MPHHTRVSADYSVYLLVTETVIAYRQRVAKHTEWNPRKSRSQDMTSEQAAIKLAWEKLSQVPIKGSYITNPNAWTCNCGSQKYHSYLLCKHLVQSIPKPDKDWWPNVRRYSTVPFYVVPGVPEPMEPEKITAHGWLSRRSNDSQESLKANNQVCASLLRIETG